VWPWYKKTKKHVCNKCYCLKYRDHFAYNEAHCARVSTKPHVAAETVSNDVTVGFFNVPADAADKEPFDACRHMIV
jgi:hypothetical protein